MEAVRFLKPKARKRNAAKMQDNPKSDPFDVVLVNQIVPRLLSYGREGDVRKRNKTKSKIKAPDLQYL